MGGKLRSALWSNWPPQPHFGYIPFEDATRSFLNGKPTHVGAAYSFAAPVAVEREDIEAVWTVSCRNRVAERDYRNGEMPYRRNASFDPVTGRFLSSHWSGIERR
jgi:hypothetical protein